MVVARRLVLALLCCGAFAQEPGIDEPEIPPPPEKSAAQWIREGDEALRSGKWEEATAAYRMAAEAGGSIDGSAEAPTTLGHDRRTPEESRRRIDALVKRLLDPFAEEADAEAAAKDLGAIGAPMAAPLLGALARERDRLEGNGTLEDDLRLTALRRGDACLRALDPFLDAMGKERIGPKSGREHVAFVLAVHYARSRTLARRRPLSAYDPPPDLPHLEGTPPELRDRIDSLVAVMLDPEAGRDSFDAKEQLAAIGKPAFPRILGAMAGVRDELTDDDTMEERLVESSLYLADQCLRLMDGYCDAKNYTPIRPGTDANYVRYILKIHYKRWKVVLKDLEEMPGPYDPR